MKTKNIVTIIIVLVILAIVSFLVYHYFIQGNNFGNRLNQSVDPSGNQYLVLRAYNTEGGFFWHIYNILCASNEAKKRNMKLVVVFDDGLYLEKNPKYLRQYAEYINGTDNNWYQYFFEPIGTDIPEIKELIQSGKLTHKTKIRSLSKYDSDIVKKKKFYEFDRAMFNVRDSNVNYGKEWKEKIIVKPHIQDIVDNFYNKNMKGYLTLAVHRRGTDKYPSHSDTEDGPLAIEYNWISDKIQNWIDNNNSNKKVRILVCSDEQPFIDHIKKTFGDEYTVLFTNAIRSNISTSGKHLQTCKNEFDLSADCMEYKKMKDTSIHKGLKHLSSYKKGEDAIVDVMLMAKCNGVFFKSRGNFSNAVTYANPKLQVVDMVSKYQEA